jgi:hypothetical protein
VAEKNNGDLSSLREQRREGERERESSGVKGRGVVVVGVVRGFIERPGEASGKVTTSS